MTVLLCGGVNEMVGIGCGIATIMMSSTPFWLVKAGGSTRLAAFATPPPAHKATITLAAHAATLQALLVCWTLASSPRWLCRQLPETNHAEIGTAASDTGYCEYQYRLFANTRITSNKLKDTFATLLWATVGRREDAAYESQNSYRCGQMETVGQPRGETDVAGSEMALRAGRSVLLFST